MLKVLPAFAVLGILMTPPAAQAQAQKDSPQELFEGASRMVMQALELLMKSVPQYEPPVILDNGDILIRRKPSPDDKPFPEHDSGPDQDRI